jgi:hypothetical protein
LTFGLTLIQRVPGARYQVRWAALCLSPAHRFERSGSEEVLIACSPPGINRIEIKIARVRSVAETRFCRAVRDPTNSIYQDEARARAARPFAPMPLDVVATNMHRTSSIPDNSTTGMGQQQPEHQRLPWTKPLHRQHLLEWGGTELTRRLWRFE